MIRKLIKKMLLNTATRYSFLEFSIKIFTFWKDFRGYYLSKSGHLIIETLYLHHTDEKF